MYTNIGRDEAGVIRRINLIDIEQRRIDAKKRSELTLLIATVSGTIIYRYECCRVKIGAIRAVTVPICLERELVIAIAQAFIGHHPSDDVLGMGLHS